MAGLSVPETGLALGPVPDATGSGKGAIHGIQIMRLSFADTAVLEDVLKHGDDLKVVFGKSARLEYGDESMEILATGQEIRQELYRDSDQPEQLDFVGLFTHILEVREVDESSVDESVLKLQENYARIKDQKAASTTMVVDSSELPPARSARRFGPLKKAPHLRKGNNQRSVSQARSISTPPSTRPSRSPVGGHEYQSSTPTSEINAKLDGLRIPLVHLLALGSASEHNLATKTRSTEELCLRILQRIANRVKAGREWELIDDHYKDLDIWDFPYKLPEDREIAIANARAAFNRLRLARDAPEWQMLLRPEDRGKVDPNPVPVKPPAKLVSSQAAANDSSKSPYALTESKGAGGDGGGRTPQAAGKTGKSKQKDPIGHIINKSKKKAAAPAKPKGPIGRPPKSASAKAAKANSQRQTAINSKIKSAEKVNDSDEEIEMVDVKLSPPKVVERTPISPRQTPNGGSKASSVVNSDIEADRLQPTKAQTETKSPKKKPRAYLPTSSAKPKMSSGNAKSVPPKDQAVRRSASNSPPKPSPLGSSPPINASDVENVVEAPSPSMPISHAGTSTASQSPSDSLAGVAKASKARNSTIPLKRKPAAQPDPDDSPQTMDHRPPASVSSSYKRQNTSSPDEYTLNLARQFKEQYAIYERLYKEAQATKDFHQQQERIGRVLVMHYDLEKLKARIVMP